MENFISLIYVNIKRMLKDPGKMVFTLIMPVMVILLVSFLRNSEHSTESFSNEKVAYNIEDNGRAWESVFPYLVENKNTFINQRKKAIELLDKGEISVVYNIPSDFTKTIETYKKPIINAYKIKEGNENIPIEIKLNESINKWIESEVLIEQGVIKSESDISVASVKTILFKDETEIDGDSNIATIMIIAFIIIGSSLISEDLIELRETNIISRSITTPNNSFSILGSIALSILIFQVSINMFILLLGKLIVGYQIFHIHIVFINIVLASLFAITLSLAVTRIFKNAGVVSIVTSLISILTLFLSTSAEDETFQNVPEFILNLGKFTPQYWIFNSLEKSVLFPNIFIVLLITTVLFTAGSYKLKDF